MRRVVVTGVGVVSPAGTGIAPLLAALEADLPLGEEIRGTGARGRTRLQRVARVPPFDRAQLLPARKLRRMAELSQLWTIACLLAHRDAGLDRAEGAAAPEKKGTFVGTGLGCTDATWAYLEGMYKDGMAAASPFLFAESVANAAGGHSAIELDARGICVTMTCGDASAAAAVGGGARALREGRLDIAYCGGVELMTNPLVGVLAIRGGPAHVGEGAACLVLETLESARRRKAPVLAEITGAGWASDPEAPATSWSCNHSTFAAAMRRALARQEKDHGDAQVGSVLLHACGWSEADRAERRAAEAVCAGAPRWAVTQVFGAHAAAGGLALAAAARRASTDGCILAHAHAWGGAACSLLFRAAERQA